MILIPRLLSKDGRAPVAIGLAALKSLKENRPGNVAEVG